MSPPRRVWTDGEKAKLALMWDDPGVAIIDILNEFHCARDTLSQLVVACGLRPRPPLGKGARRKKSLVVCEPVGSEAKVRRCLMCAEEFNSAHMGERVCPSCKSSDAWQRGPDFTTFGGPMHPRRFGGQE